MVDIEDIADFPGLPGQRPVYAAPSAVAPVAVVLVNARMDVDYRNIVGNTPAQRRAAVDAFIAAEVAAGRAYQTTVERWDPWSALQVQLPLATAAQWNYARFTVGGKPWYAFVDADYLNLTDSVYRVAADAWTTYDFTLGRSVVEEGHLAVAASAGGDITWASAPEDIGVGELIAYGSHTPDVFGPPRILVISTTDLTAPPLAAVPADLASGDFDANPYTFANGTIPAGAWPAPPVTYTYSLGSSSLDDYYEPAFTDGSTQYRPVVRGSATSIVDGIPANGGAYVYPSAGAFEAHMAGLSDAPWIAAGIQAVMPIPGGSSGGTNALRLGMAWGAPAIEAAVGLGAPTVYSSLDTGLSADVGLGSLTDPLPAAYGQWAKLRTLYAAVAVGDGQGGQTEWSALELPGSGPLTLHVEGAFYPAAEVAAWLVNGGGAAPWIDPVGVPYGGDYTAFSGGRNGELATSAMELAAGRSQAFTQMLVGTQSANFNAESTQATTNVNAAYSILSGGLVG